MQVDNHHPMPAYHGPVVEVPDVQFCGRKVTFLNDQEHVKRSIKITGSLTALLTITSLAVCVVTYVYNKNGAQQEEKAMLAASLVVNLSLFAIIPLTVILIRRSSQFQRNTPTNIPAASGV